MNVTVYTKPGCVQCEWTKKMLDKQGTDYQVIDVSESTMAQDILRELGYTALPVVVVNNGPRTGHWSGFKLDKLRGLKDTGGY